MVTVFFYLEGVILIDFMEKGMTINSEYYCGLLRRMHDQLWRKRPGKMRWKPILLQDNRSAACVKAFLGDHCRTRSPNFKASTLLARFVTLRFLFVSGDEKASQREEI